MISSPVKAGMPASSLPLSPVVRVGDILFVSGQASVDAQGKIVSDSFENEMRRSIANLVQILDGAGSDLANVVQTRNYVRNPDDLAAFNQIYREFFKPPYPARTTIMHCLPEALKYEIKCIAVAGGQ